MEVRVEVTSLHWLDERRASLNADIWFGDEWLSVNHIEVHQKDEDGRAFGVYVPQRKGGKSQPALFLSDDLYGLVRRAAIAAFKAGR